MGKTKAKHRYANDVAVTIPERVPKSSDRAVVQGDTCPQGTLGKLWRHLWLSELGDAAGT